jgi:hypothetical protein
MDARALTLNIAVNLGRLSRWSMEGRRVRVDQFLTETEEFVRALEAAPKSPQLVATFQSFKVDFERLRSNVSLSYDWADTALTWANILTHRASLA